MLPAIGYYVTPFGIEGSPSICDKIAGVYDPFYHFTHAPPSLFESLLERDDYQFLYQIRDPRDSVISWAYHEISTGNAKGKEDIEQLIQYIILSKFCLAEHIQRAREWYEMGNKVFRISFDQTKADKKLVINNILEFLNISHLIKPEDVDGALTEFSDSRYRKTLRAKEHRLYELNLVRENRGISGAWENGLSATNKLLFKKVAGDFLIELGYERDFNW